MLANSRWTMNGGYIDQRRPSRKSRYGNVSFQIVVGMQRELCSRAILKCGVAKFCAGFVFESGSRVPFGHVCHSIASCEYENIVRSARERPSAHRFMRIIRSATLL